MYSELLQDYLFNTNENIFYLMKNLGGSKGCFNEKRLIEYVLKYCKISGSFPYKSELEVKRILNDLVECNFLQTTQPKKEKYYFFTKKSWDRLFDKSFNQQIKNSWDSYLDWENKITFLEKNYLSIHNPDVQNPYDFIQTYNLNTFFSFDDEKENRLIKALRVNDNKELYLKALRSLNGLGFKVLNLSHKQGVWVLFPLNINNNNEFISSVKNALKKGIKQIETLSYDETNQKKNIIIVAIPNKYKQVFELQAREIILSTISNNKGLKTNEDIEAINNIRKTKIVAWFY